MKIAIIGAGPVGSYTAQLLSKKGFNVHLFDKKTISQIGQPIQCTGLLTSDIQKFIPLNNNFLINTFSHLQVFSPNQQKITLNKTEFLINRKKFDQYLINLALKHNAIFHPRHKLTQIKNKTLTFQHKNQTKTFSPDIIIAADGPLSLIRQHLNPNQKRTLYFGHQAVIKGNFNPTTYQTFFGNKTSPNLFAWLVPESKTKARIGLAALKNPHFYFNNFLRKLKINQNQIIEKQAGLIPLFNPKTKTCYKNIFLLGDAASHVKATTLGGIIPAFQEAKNLANSISQNKPYRPHLKNLKLHLFLRKTLNKFSDQDYNKLIYLLSKPKNKKLLETHSRENPKKLFKKLILKEPRLLCFAKHLF